MWTTYFVLCSIKYKFCSAGSIPRCVHSQSVLFCSPKKLRGEQTGYAQHCTAHCAVYQSSAVYHMRSVVYYMYSNVYSAVYYMYVYSAAPCALCALRRCTVRTAQCSAVHVHVQCSAAVCTVQCSTCMYSAAVCTTCMYSAGACAVCAVQCSTCTVYYIQCTVQCTTCMCTVCYMYSAGACAAQRTRGLRVLSSLSSQKMSKPVIFGPQKIILVFTQSLTTYWWKYFSSVLVVYWLFNCFDEI